MINKDLSNPIKGSRGGGKLSNPMEGGSKGNVIRKEDSDKGKGRGKGNTPYLRFRRQLRNQMF